MAVDTGQVRELRERTGAGIMDCKQALAEAQGNLEKALGILRQKGLTKAANKAGRTTSEGVITSYIHPGGRIGVLLELNCETDFVARNPEFQDLAKDLALQIAGASPPPQYVQREDIPGAVLEEEKALFLSQIQAMGKPQKVADQIVSGKLEKYFEEVCLLEQPFIKDPGMRVQDVLAQKVGKIGENIRVRRFTRYRLGEAS